MPRTKLVMKLIENPKKRKTTYKNRKEGLVQKISQLTTLCGIDAFLICFGPAEGVTLWPPNHHVVRDLIRRYQILNAQNKTRQNVNTSTFLQDEIAKQKRKLLKITQCGTDDVLTPWDCRLDDLTEMDLRDLLVSLDQTLQRTQQRVAALGGQSTCNVQPSAPAPIQPPPEIMWPDNVFQYPYSYLDTSHMNMTFQPNMLMDSFGGSHPMPFGFNGNDASASAGYYYDNMTHAVPPYFFNCQMPSTSNVPSDCSTEGKSSVPLLPYAENVKNNTIQIAGFDGQQFAGSGLDPHKSVFCSLSSLNSLSAATFQLRNGMAKPPGSF